MRRIALLVAVLMLMSVGGLATAFEPATVGPIYPWWTKWSQTTVDVGDTVLLGNRWGACTKGLAWSGRNAVDLQYWIRPLDDNPGNDDDWVKIRPKWEWQRPVPMPYEEGAWPSAENCIPPTEHSWYILAEYPYVFSKAGDYLIQPVHTVTRPIPDGNDFDGDGRPDVGQPYDWTFIGSGIVHVMP